MPAPEPLQHTQTDLLATGRKHADAAPEHKTQADGVRTQTRTTGFQAGAAALTPDHAERALRPTPGAHPKQAARAADAREEARLVHEVLPKLAAMGQHFETRREVPGDANSALIFFKSNDPARTYTARSFGSHADRLLHETLRIGGDASLKTQLAKLEAFPVWLAQQLYVPPEEQMNAMVASDLHRLVRLAQTSVHGAKPPEGIELAFAEAGKKAQPFVKAMSPIVQWVPFLLAGGALTWSVRLKDVIDMAFDTAELVVNTPDSRLNPLEQAVRAFEPPPMTLSNLGPKQRVFAEVAYFKPATLQILLHRFCRNHGVRLSFAECGQWAPRVNLG